MSSAQVAGKILMHDAKHEACVARCSMNERQGQSVLILLTRNQRRVAQVLKVGDQTGNLSLSICKTPQKRRVEVRTSPIKLLRIPPAF
jgi:hypothetical protein